jgi:ankyrin repeat protein
MSNSELACGAGSLLFQLVAGPLIQVGNKEIDNCCRILLRLCHLGSLIHQAIVHRYFEVHGQKPDGINPAWLEDTALSGSLYAMNSLCDHFPDRYLQLKQTSPNQVSNEEKLLAYCRNGDYVGCKEMLSYSTSAIPKEGMASPLHWLVSFDDEEIANDLLLHLLENGADFDAWGGGDYDIDFGNAAGTPLHWAVWHRNICVVKALTRADPQPGEENITIAIMHAAGMLFYDILGVLKDWVIGLEVSSSQEIWYRAMICAAYEGEKWLPRLLRHGQEGKRLAFERTMDIIATMHLPSPDDVKVMFEMAMVQNNDALIGYLFQHFGLGDRRDLLAASSQRHWVSVSIVAGYREIFEIFIEQGYIGPRTDISEQKWKPLQACCFTRQRDATFVRCLLEIGCPVDDVGVTDTTCWTPFTMAVLHGLYHIAVIFLEHGADKDYLMGSLGGATPAMRILETWPDIPLSRLKFLLEEVPDLGFGHVSFIGWPGAGSNLLYPMAMTLWSSYPGGYQLAQTTKYILSRLEDKSVLNKIDKLGATALRMASGSGRVDICQLLIDAGQDVNLSMGVSPLTGAKAWLSKCQRRESAAASSGPGSELRLATDLRVQAEATVNLLLRHGATERGYFEQLRNTSNVLHGGQWNYPSLEVNILSFAWVVILLISPRFKDSIRNIVRTGRQVANG